MSEVNLASIDANELLLLLGGIGVVGIIGGWLSKKMKVPDVVIYLIAGILAGPFFLNIINIGSFPVANEIIISFGSAFILYEGGREIKLSVLDEVKITVALLSTIGVVISMLVVGLGAYFVFDLPFSTCLLLGAIIASTDPASLIPVFSQVNIINRLKQAVISESAFNDAVGAILVTTLTSVAVSNEFILSESVIQLLMMIIVGTLVGIAIGLAAEALSSEKAYGIFREFGPIISVLEVLLAYEIAERLQGSGYMAVFIAGLIAGNRKRFGLWIPEESYRSALHFRENIATLSRMAIFIVLGTQVNLTSLITYAPYALLVVLVLMFIARPVVVLVCALPDRKVKWQKKELLFKSN